MARATTSLISLVGAGPGDPDLLTLKALKRLQNAEVLVYDRLISQEILDLVPAGTARIYVGKANGQHTYDQDEINALLVKLGRAGHRVVRLKGGDPFVFGRGSEEASFLALHGLDFEIIPGITAAAGCTASFGIPLTHRGAATGVRFVTGHCQSGRDLDLNWESLADPDTTLVVYMGLAHIGEIACRLIENGLSSDTPAVAIANGTCKDETAVTGTLASMPDRVQRADLKAPVLLVVGKVVAIRETLAMNHAGEDTAEMAATAPQAGHG